MNRLFLVFLIGACGAGQPPAGPAYVPESSKEADTSCPNERKKAQEARELLLGTEDSELTRAAATKVLAQAHCEVEALRAAPVPAGSHELILTGLRELRERVQGVDNLVVEVLRYEVPALQGAAWLEQSQLKMVFASKVASITPPAELDGPAKLEFESELKQAIDTLRAEGEMLSAEGCSHLAALALEDERCR